MTELYAHSARPDRGIEAQPYNEHVDAVLRFARGNASRAAFYHDGDRPAFVRAVSVAGIYHDIGKVEDIKQVVLGSDSRAPLPGVPHEEAGVARLVGDGDLWAAALIAGHHDGLFDGKEQRERSRSVEQPPLLRQLDPDVLGRVDACLSEWLGLHQSAGCPTPPGRQSAPPDPVTLRLALSCVVDADHGDTAAHQWGRCAPDRPRRRWDERLRKLAIYAGEKPKVTERDRRRQRFFDGCMGVVTDSRILSCMAPVGSGKTLGVMAHMLRAARARSLRHIFVVLPYTNIITQAVDEYRAALTLPGENPEEVVAELHHQAEFESLDGRELAALWRAPIIVTTAVGFFETLAGARPGRLRKMHELPGSAVFVDEAHAALPQHLWPLAWRWMEALCDHWGMQLVLGSGSLFRFWEQPEFLKNPTARAVPELTPGPVLHDLQAAESVRIRPCRLVAPLTVERLVETITKRDGPRVIVLNTVRSASTVAKHFRDVAKLDTLHLSTALAPIDREPIIFEIKRRLREEPDRTWVLVATSCIEAGLNFSFRLGCREAFGVANLLQLGGRVRRDEEPWAGELISFSATGPGISSHPAAKESAAILNSLLDAGEFDRHDPATLLKMAFERSLRGSFTKRRNELMKLESDCQYPQVQKEFRVIEADTRLVLVNETLIERVSVGEKVRFSELVRGAVQIYATRLERLPCEQLRGRREIWAWRGRYCKEFLGYLADEEAIEELYRAGGAVV